jgi:hypothetical protein
MSLFCGNRMPTIGWNNPVGNWIAVAKFRGNSGVEEYNLHNQ